MTVSLQTYLCSVKAAAAQAQLIVLGNEAADLDSMASSIAYGYLRRLQDAQLLVLPVMPIPRADFILRPEAAYVFKEAGINIADVVFFDEVDLEKLLGSGSALLLVDHNRLSLQLAQYSNKVVGVLDHHQDEGLYSDVRPRVIQTMGSTASLVALEFEKAGVDMGCDVAALLCGTILLDTVNLAPEAGRVAGADRAVVSRILSLCPLSQQEFFDTAQREKFNITGLSTSDLLRKDYKEFQFADVRGGIVSALLSIADWAKLDSSLCAGFATFAGERDLDVLLLMNAYENPDFGRDLVVFCQTEGEHDGLYNYLQENGLELTPLEFPRQLQGEHGFMQFYSQGNLGVSRKKLQPLLSHFYQG